MHWLLHIFGADNGSGIPYLAGSSWIGLLVEFFVLSGISWLAQRLFRRLHERRMAQDRAHHTERLAQALEHHTALVKLHEKHHRQALDQAADHHEALKAHITAQTPTPAPATLPVPRSRKTGGGM